MISKIKNSVDWVLLGSILLISLGGLFTMNSFTGKDLFFSKQIIWIGISSVVLISASIVEWRFLRKTRVVTFVFIFSIISLASLFVVGSIFKGARSWFDFGSFSFQPVDFGKLVLILVLAKYFSRRHIEIANIRHILVSGFYAFILFSLVLLQPDFGGAIIIFLIWFGMVLVSGISKKHLLTVFAVGALSFLLLWSYGFKEYQKQRILSFVHPLADLRGAGYNAYQSTIAVGSGEIMGKGIGYGTQSKLRFLPEYETDFIFASFAEEWGFVGVMIFFTLYGVVIWRVLSIAYRGETNFEILYGFGISILFMSHFAINVGMNMGLLPVTGITLPFMSYGGSHLVMEFLAIGILMGTRHYARATHRNIESNELIQVS